MIVERREKDAAAQIKIVHAEALRQKLDADDGRPSGWSGQANFPSPASCCYHGFDIGRRRQDMSEFGIDAIRGVPWPSNGLSEVPFRLYTDPEQYRLEQERIFKGPTWSFLCLAATCFVSNGKATSKRSNASTTAGLMI